MDKGLDFVSISRSMEHPTPALHPLSWRDWARPHRSYSSEPRQVGGAIIQRWERSSPRMNQPALDHHYIVVHLGGPKRVTRSRRTHKVVRDLAPLAMSTIEAGSSYRWATEGPVAFGHVYLKPEYFSRTIGEQFDCDPAKVRMAEQFGELDPLLGHLLHALVRAVEGDDISAMEQEAQLEVALHRLFERQAARSLPERRVLISPGSVARVKDYIGEHLHDQITLDDLAGLVGYSRFHFARGFKAATGMPPYAFILRARIALACRLLEENRLSVQAVGSKAGFASHPQFTSRFRQLTGLTPSGFRQIVR